MTKQLTKRQALFILIICFVANKTQRLPCLISANLGRFGWLVTLLFGMIEVIMLCLFLFTNRLAQGRTCYQLCRQTTGTIGAKIIMILFATYFMLNALLPYEAVHEVFSNVLFNHLPWELYSIFIVFALGFFATRGLRTIGRMNELFIWLVMMSLLLLLVLGGFTTNYARILPFYDISARQLFSSCLGFSMWFGDFLVMYVIMGNVKEDDGKMNFWFVLALLISVFLMTFAYIIFYGIYGVLSSEQTNAISAISQFSLLSLDIGRVDWFLVLFFEFATFISSGIFIFCAGRFICELFNKKYSKPIAWILVFSIYFLDIFVFKSVGQGVSVLAKIVKFAYPFFVILLPFIVFVISIVFNIKNKKLLKTYPGIKSVRTLQGGLRENKYNIQVLKNNTRREKHKPSANKKVVLRGQGK